MIRCHHLITKGPMGVRRLFSRGGQNFPGRGGQKHTICSKKHLKKYYFPQKNKKKILLWSARGRGQGHPLALPCGRPWKDNKLFSTTCILCNKNLPVKRSKIPHSIIRFCVVGDDNGESIFRFAALFCLHLHYWWL